MGLSIFAHINLGTCAHPSTDVHVLMSSCTHDGTNLERSMFQQTEFMFCVSKNKKESEASVRCPVIGDGRRVFFNFETFDQVCGARTGDTAIACLGQMRHLTAKSAVHFPDLLGSEVSRAVAVQISSWTRKKVNILQKEKKTLTVDSWRHRFFPYPAGLFVQRLCL